MINTQTLEIQAKVHNSAKRPISSRVHSQNRAYGACVVATATQKTVDHLTLELAANEAKTAELEQERELALKDIGFESMETFLTALNAGKLKNTRMGIVTNIQGLTIRISKRQIAAAHDRKVLPELGDEVIVVWKSDVQAAEKEAKTARCSFYLHQGYTLAIRTDIKTTSKPERSKTK